MAFIRVYQKQYPDSIDLLATKGDYLKIASQREKCLLKAYALAKEKQDKKNRVLISSSLAVLYFEVFKDAAQCTFWMGKLRKALAAYPDKDEELTVSELESALKNATRTPE